MKTNVNNRDIMLKNGLYLGGITIALGVIMYVSGITYSGNTLLQSIFSLVGFAAFIVFIVLGIRQFKNDNGGFLQLSDALKIGIGVALIGAIIGGVYTYVFTTIIEPDYYQKIAQITAQQLSERFPNMSEEEIKKATEFGQKFTSPVSTFMLSLVGNIFFGLIVSLIAGAVMQKKEPNF